jgi:hypothetical protein
MKAFTITTVIASLVQAAPTVEQTWSIAKTPEPKAICASMLSMCNPNEDIDLMIQDRERLYQIHQMLLQDEWFWNRGNMMALKSNR